jgi:hypothetical protein
MAREPARSSLISSLITAENGSLMTALTAAAQNAVKLRYLRAAAIFCDGYFSRRQPQIRMAQLDRHTQSHYALLRT